MTGAMVDPAAVYVDVTSLSQTKLTGVGRCVARVVQALAAIRPIRLFSMARLEDLRDHGQKTGLHQGLEIELASERLPPDDCDIHDWRDSVFSLPSRPFDHGASVEAVGIYTFRRSVKKRFAREVSVHFDLTACVVPHTHESQTRQEFSQLVEQMIPLDDGLMAISKSTRDDLVWLGGADARKVDWCHLGPSQCLGAHAWKGDSPRRDPGLFLAVSTIEPRKNPGILLEWFLTSPVLPERARLVWAGPSGWMVDRGKIPGSRNGRAIDFLGMVSDSELCRLHSSARCLVYPSIYEGFGFPVLDSLLHGTPVICSGNSSLLEFAGPGVHFADPFDFASIDAAWMALRESEWPVERADLEVSCSWPRFAGKLLELACGGRP